MKTPEKHAVQSDKHKNHPSSALELLDLSPAAMPARQIPERPKKPTPRLPRRTTADERK